MVGLFLSLRGTQFLQHAKAKSSGAFIGAAILVGAYNITLLELLSLVNAISQIYLSISWLIIVIIVWGIGYKSGAIRKGWRTLRDPEIKTDWTDIVIFVGVSVDVGASVGVAVEVGDGEAVCVREGGMNAVGVTVGDGEAVGVREGGMNAVGVTVGVKVTVGVGLGATVRVSAGIAVAEAGMDVGVDVTVVIPGARRIAIHPAQ